jgi:hypothetical protein
MAGEPPYPVRLEGRRDDELSRWLWLVKWLLAIPHYIVLAILGIAFAVLTVVAFFAILVTGRYPRGIFDFNVGVLRWTWRVAFYSYAALGTDRYPPFTLGPEPDYPATLEVDYPEALSRGLVLVKWWLLAIPQYVLVGIFLGGTWAAWGDELWDWGFAGGLIGVLVLFAGVALLFMGRYPAGIYDFVLGLDRWVARVAAYATLMTDRYPPFRLDAGPTEAERPPAAAAPGPEPEPAAEAEAAPAAAPVRPAGGGGAGRVLLFVLGSIAALIAFALLAGGCAVVVVDRTQRDDDGFLMTPTETFSTETYAIVSESVDIDIDGPDWVAEDFVGTVRIRSESGRPVFVGIGRDTDVERYLAGVGRAVVTDIGQDPEYDVRPGAAPRGPPGAQGFWEASTSGAGEQTLEWELEDGSWSVVVMNATASPGVTSGLSIGAELDALLWIGLAMLAVGTLFAAGAAAAITAGARRGRR